MIYGAVDVTTDEINQLRKMSTILDDVSGSESKCIVYKM
jgi:hypothetical protein